MKKYAILTALLLVLGVPSLALSQGTAGGQPPSSSGNPSGSRGWGNRNGSGGQEEEVKRFQEHKAEALSHINQHLEEIVQRKRCVEAANDHQALRTCMPQGGGGNQNEGGRGGPPASGENQGNERGGMHP